MYEKHMSAIQGLLCDKLEPEEHAALRAAIELMRAEDANPMSGPTERRRHEQQIAVKRSEFEAAYRMGFDDGVKSVTGAR